MKRLTLFMISLILLLLTACTEGNETPIRESEKKEATVEEEITTENKKEDETEKVNTEPTDGALSISDNLVVHFIDVGQADATLLEYKDKEKSYHILYDTGDWRGNEVVQYLTSQGVDMLDLIIISHPDADHIGQLDQVMEAVEVGEVWMSGNESTSDTFQRAIESILTSDADYYEPRAGDNFEVGPLQIDILYPQTITGNSNEESLAALFSYGSIKFIFTGDASRDGETYMQTQFDVKADVLHIGHHGSNTSSDPKFIDAVSPAIAVYSAGANNSYGHPHPEVVSSFAEREIELYGTDVHGTVIVTTDGKEISVNTSSQGEISYGKKNQSELQQEANESIAEEQVHPGECININEASLEEVQEIIHIGPERAEDLIEQRPYQGINDLKRISGIGESRIADIKSEGTACIQ